jgi:TonB family protein
MPTLEAELDQTASSAPVPQLLVELPSRRKAFLANLRDLVSPRELPPLEPRSAPAPFWHDVFVKRELPWTAFLKSGVFHVLACALLIAFARLLALQPHVVATPAFDRSQVVLYSPSEYLPPIDTREARAAEPKKADPEFSRQPIISVPREADNRAQTVVTPPQVRLKRDLALPNMVAWSDSQQRPQLYIPPAPLTLAADITRITPQMNSVVAPPPDASHLTRRRDQSALQTDVVAPPPDNVERMRLSTAGAPQAVIAPPPSVENPANRLGDITIGRTAVIAPAPALPVAAQRSFSGTRSSTARSQVVPPPPSAPASGSFGAQGRVVALNLHPAVGAPPSSPSGNRRGSFAATPEGHAGASGSPGSTSPAAKGNDAGGSTKKASGNLPAGLYVGDPPPSTKTSAVAGNGTSAPANTVNPNLLGATSSSHPLNSTRATTTQPEAAKLTDAERAVFGNRKFYSVALTMPNLNSVGGSWIIRFAELNHSGNPADGDWTKYNAASRDAQPAADLSQPQPTRKVDPAYPLELMKQNVAGTVILYAVIQADGSVSKVRVLRGVDARLDQFASEALAQWKFDPATKNGSPVAVEATFQIPFRPTRLGTNF